MQLNMAHRAKVRELRAKTQAAHSMRLVSCAARTNDLRRRRDKVRRGRNAIPASKIALGLDYCGCGHSYLHFKNATAAALG